MNKFLSKYFFYYPITALRGEWVWKYYRHYESLQWSTIDLLHDYQYQNLKRILNHAYTSVPYYNRILNEQGVTPDDISCLDDIARIPTTTKDDVVNNIHDLHSTKRFIFRSDKTTGGSTGQAVTISKNADALARERAATWRAYKWAGIEIGDLQARFWGTPLSKKGKLFYKAVDYVSNRTRLSAFNINKNSLEKYYRELVKLEPRYFYGYVSMIVEFAIFVIEKNYPSIPGLKCIITTSEVLDQNSKELIESAFKTRVFNEYGCGEVGSIAHECEHGNMHIMAENLIIEIDTENNPDGATGEIIVTDLHNYAMPLIRYRLGDFATLSSSPCNCGRGLPVIKRIHGRAYDILVGPDGNKYHPEIIMYIFEELKTQDAGIKQFQIIQTDLNHLLVIIVPDQGFKISTEKIIISRIREIIHPGLEVKFQYSQYINREKSGKIRIIKSTVLEERQ